MWTPLDSVDQPLHVVTCISNTQRYKSRYKLYRDFQRHVREGGAILHTVEAAFGERNFALEDHAQRPTDNYEDEWKSAGPPNVPNKGHGTYTQVRIDHLQEIWLKENLLNIGVSRLPYDWKYVAFVDADVMFARPDWVSETLHQLQRYHIVQMFSDAIDLYPDYSPQPMVQQKSHGWCHVHGMLNEHVTKQNNGGKDSYGPKSVGTSTVKVSQQGGSMYRHPGFAWAWRREAFNMVGGLMEHVLLGSADWHMAWALLGRVEETISRGLSEPYRDLCRRWERRAVEHIKFNVGYVPGTLMHNWHGKKRDRGYATRWEIMVANGYDPLTDLKKDWQGVLRLTDQKPKLRDDCRSYFARRNEDSIDV